jgi:ribosomal protein S7
VCAGYIRVVPKAPRLKCRSAFSLGAHLRQTTLCLCAALLLGGMLGGCAFGPLYNEARDKQGKALTTAVSTVDFVAVVEELDKKYAALAEIEVTTLRARLATSRDIEISRVASSTGDQATLSLNARYVVPLLEGRLAQLVGTSPALGELSSLLQDAAATDPTASQALSAIRTFSAVSGLNIQDCAAVARLMIKASDGSADISQQALDSIPAAKRLSASALFKSAVAKCEVARDLGSAATGGLIKDLATQLATETRQVQAYRVRLQAQQVFLAEKESDFAREASAITPAADEAGYRAKLAQAAAKLGKALETLSKVTGEDALAQAHAEALAKLGALEAITGALASGVSDPANLTDSQRQALALVRLIPTVADETDKLLKDAQRPRLGPFLLAKEHQRLIVEGFQKYVALLERRVATRQRQLQQAMLELKAVAGARLALGPPMSQAKGATVNLDQSMAATVSGGTDAQRYALYQSFARYFDEAYRYRVEQESLGLNVLTMSYELEIEKSRTAALMWQSLVTNMASILADFHAAGLKPTELAEFLKGFGLIYIGERAIR